MSKLDRIMRELGFQAPVRPLRKDGKELHPELPYDLTALNDVQLGKLYTSFTRMSIYAKVVTAKAAYQFSTARRKLKAATTMAYLAETGGREDRKAKAEVDSEVQSYANVVIEAEARMKLGEAMLEGYLLGKEAISRELSRRLGLDRGGDGSQLQR